MSFGIGPVQGKRTAVERAVREAKVYPEEGNPQAEAARAYLLAELALIPEDKHVCVGAFGHADATPGNRQVQVFVNYLPASMATIPALVE